VIGGGLATSNSLVNSSRSNDALSKPQRGTTFDKLKIFLTKTTFAMWFFLVLNLTFAF
jgi:hypothetical protein